MKASETLQNDESTANETALHRAVDTTPAFIHTARPNGYLDYFNRGWLDFLGKSLEEVCGWKWTECVHPEDVATLIQKWHAALASGEPLEVESRVRRADGTYRAFLHRKVPVRDEHGNIAKWFGSSIDIEDRKCAEQRMAEKTGELERSEFYLREGERLAHMGSWSLRPDGIFDYWSPETFVIFGFDPSEGIPTLPKWLTVLHPHDRDLLAKTLERIFRESVRVDVTYRVDHPKQGKRIMHSTGEPVVEDGKVMRLIGNTLDITEQENAIRELKKAFGEIRALKDELYKENIVLRHEIGSTSMFEEVLGTSSALQNVLALAAKVAPTDSSVLIAGETGTGKELIARAIHKRSKRGERSFVGVNCAAIPSSLIMSELFGHEKGAFTGAVQRRLGRFELAEGGTLFLDEVGDLPLETQIALLRVMQEREFERVGGTEMLRCDCVKNSSAIIPLGFHLQLNGSRLTESVSKTATRIWNFFPMSFRRNSCRSVLFNDTRFLNPSMRYELETSWHVLIASASSIGYDWGPAACRRWNEDVFSPFRDSSRFRRQSPDCCAHRTLNVPNSVLEL